MKKLLIALVLGSAMLLFFAVGVMADNGPHGNFTANTDACASCHRAHSAQYGSNGLTVLNPEALCLSCHDGTNAYTNVKDGKYMTGGTEGAANGSLFGGGFVNAIMATNWGDATAATSRPTTSSHSLGVSGKMYGAGGANSTAGNWVLECTSCHDPHGKAGYQMTQAANGTWTASATKTASYRLLRWRPQGSNGFTEQGDATSNWTGGAFPTNGTETGWTVPDYFAGTEWYTIGNTNAFAAGDYLASSGSGVYNVTAASRNYVNAAQNTAYFCAQCHDRYFTNSNLRNAASPSMYCGTIQTILPAHVNGKTIPVVAADPVTGLHPTDPENCIQGTWSYRISGPPVSYVYYEVWGDNRPSGDDTYMYMHTSGDVLRTSRDGVANFTTNSATSTQLARSCMACHVSHGTAAQMTALASGATLANGGSATANNSVLLRMDNRATCLRCHASTVNYP